MHHDTDLEPTTTTTTYESLSSLINTNSTQSHSLSDPCSIHLEVRFDLKSDGWLERNPPELQRIHSFPRKTFRGRSPHELRRIHSFPRKTLRGRNPHKLSSQQPFPRKSQFLFRGRPNQNERIKVFCEQKIQED